MEILQKDNPVLREIAKTVPIEDITTSAIQNVIRDLKETMAPVEDAVAIAAPQIGILLRIFVVSGRAFIKKPDADGKRSGLEERGGKRPDRKESVSVLDTLPPDLVCINPKIIKQSKKMNELEEGCLSVRWLYGDTKRATKVTIKAYDEHGKLSTRGASGLLAQIFQHEIDHLNGILFIDHAKDVREITSFPQTQKGGKNPPVEDYS